MRQTLSPRLTSNLWYRESTQEWVFEVEFRVEGFTTSISRFVGETELDALKDFRDNFHQVLSVDIQYLEKAEFGMGTQQDQFLEELEQL